MLDTSVASVKVVRSLTNGVLDQEVLGFPIFYLLIAVALVLVIVALGISTLREKRRRNLIDQLQTKKRAMDSATKDMFTARKADDIKEAVSDPGKPQTRISEGSVAYSETGEMLVFKSSSAVIPGDAMAAAVAPVEEAKVGVQVPATWSASYRMETTPWESLTRKSVRSTRWPPPLALDSISPAHSTELANDSSVARTCH